MHPSYHPVVFDTITGDSVRTAVLKCRGGTGLLGLDAAAWQRMCTTFKGRSYDLRNAVALLARRICTEGRSTATMSAFTACRLTALDKSPGVHPIGVAQLLRRIVGKVTISAMKPDILQAVGTTQLCAGQDGGCEAAVHAMRLTFADDNCQGALLVDASNAFNRLNRKVALQNVRLLCPSLAMILHNVYQDSTSLYVDGETIPSNEGTTQGLTVSYGVLRHCHTANDSKVQCARAIGRSMVRGRCDWCRKAHAPADMVGSPQ